MLTPANKSGRYIGIKSDGLFHEKVTAGTEGAILREYELKDGTKGSKWELLYKDVKDVHIAKIEFEDSDFGENILTTFTDGENEVIWAEGTNTNYGSDYMKKLPNIDFAEKLTIQPYAFTDERGKERRGVTIYQKSDKTGDYFWDGKKNLHGFPSVDKEVAESYDKDDWRMHFIKVKKFLTNYTKENILPKFADSSLEEFKNKVEYPENNHEASPF